MSALAAPQTRAEWLEERRTYLGGSDVAAILGENSRKTPLQVWHQKQGIEDGIDNAKMRFGREFEPFVAQRYVEISQNPIVRDVPLRRHPVHEYFGANPDGLLTNGPGALECKTGINHPGGVWSWGRPWTDEVPRVYLIQGVWYAYILNLEFVDYAWFDRESCEVQCYRVWRDLEYESLLASMAEEWWQKHIVGDVPPEPKEGDLDDLKNQFPKDNGVILQASAELEAQVSQMVRLKRDAAPLYKEAKDIEAIIKAAMGEASTLALVGGQKVTWKNNSDQVETDWEGLARHLATEPIDPGLIASFSTTKPGARVFRAPK